MDTRTQMDLENEICSLNLQIIKLGQDKEKLLLASLELTKIAKQLRNQLNDAYSMIRGMQKAST